MSVAGKTAYGLARERSYVRHVRRLRLSRGPSQHGTASRDGLATGADWQP